MKALALVLFCTLAIAGCSDENRPFDASTDAAVKASLARMTKNLTAEESEQLILDCEAIMIGKDGSFEPEDRFTTGLSGTFRKVHGLTVEQIHDRAKAIRAERGG